MKEDELFHLLDECKIWNQAHGLTGMLLYIEGRFLSELEGRFMQVLEGSEQEVKNIFEKIKTDKRHHNIILLKQSLGSQRNFASWSMGFEAIKLDTCKAHPECFELNEDFLTSDQLQQSSLPLNFLKSFYEVGFTGGKAEKNEQ